MRAPTLLLSAALLGACATTLHAQTSYTDPEQRYTLQVPAGWRVEPQGGGVSLVNGPAYASVIRVSGRGAPKSLVEALAQRFPSQWQGFAGSSAGDTQFGGKPGAYGWFTGTNPLGIEAVLKLVATVDGESGYAMMISSPRSDFPKYKQDLEKIEAGFRLTTPGARK
ncbi:hypothetical protein [Variovorax sp. OV329]|uniref:hypothetical protein n=1 Tax=Variovorax sp. OV329 TaxID=1882825 RepID=UPI0008E8FCC5|nr:hypothetical protein [Variovorax sp. OV329]SFM14644.1 hypothetical protein SAMN05444747_10315 [Variovorax sp. OV329]